MNKREFMEAVKGFIEDMLMSVQGSKIYGVGTYTPHEAARDITAMVPDYVWDKHDVE